MSRLRLCARLVLDMLERDVELPKRTETDRSQSSYPVLACVSTRLRLVSSWLSQIPIPRPSKQA